MARATEGIQVGVKRRLHYFHAEIPARGTAAVIIEAIDSLPDSGQRRQGASTHGPSIRVTRKSECTCAIPVVYR